MTLTDDATFRILVIDDSITVRMTLRDLFVEQGYEVLLAEGGDEGIGVLRSEQVDVVILDLLMPGKSGADTLREIMADEDLASTPIILLTAVTDRGELVDCLDMGANDFVVKPWDDRELLGRVRSKVNAARKRIAKDEQALQAARLLAESNIELSQVSRIDPLTQLFNRRAIEESLTLEHDRSARHEHVYSIVMMDVDHFKLFNDSQGHQAGDDCLQQVAQCAQQAVRTSDMLGRYGGEEFIALLPETELADAQVVAERIRDAVYERNIPHPASKTADRVTVSIGVAAGPGERWEHLVKQADEALYSAKESGRNRVCARQDRVPTANVSHSE